MSFKVGDNVVYIGGLNPLNKTIDKYEIFKIEFCYFGTTTTTTPPGVIKEPAKLVQTFSLSSKNNYFQLYDYDVEKYFISFQEYRKQKLLKIMNYEI